MGNARYRHGFRVTLHPDLIDLPKRWREPRLIFVNSMRALFHEHVPLAFIQRVFATMRDCPHHTFQILTKRSARLRSLAGQMSWPANVWVGVSVENARVLHRIDDLRAVPATVRFLSCEPLIGPLDDLPLEGIHWVIVGGESGPGARPIKGARREKQGARRIEWMRSSLPAPRSILRLGTTAGASARYAPARVRFPHETCTMASEDTATQAITAAELQRLPSRGGRYSLIKGELRTRPPAGGEHGSVAMHLAASLYQAVAAHNLGRVYAAETGFLLATHPDTVLAPDAAFIRRERVEQIGNVTGFLPAAPDLAVEVISPSDTYIEVEEKVSLWLQHGTQMVVVVNPRRRGVTVYRPGQPVLFLTEHDELSGDDVVPGWRVRVQELFR